MLEGAERLDAEQRRYELGASQPFFVLQAQADLTTAESEVLAQSIGLSTARTPRYSRMRLGEPSGRHGEPLTGAA